MRRFVAGILVFLMVAGSSHASPATAACASTGEGTLGTALKIWGTTLSTIYNIFPIRIGGIPIGTFGGLEDFDATSTLPACVCSDPFPRIGIKVSMWEPISYLEATSIPGCFPSLGFGVPIPTPRGQMGMGSSDANKQGLHSYNLHYVKFPLFAALNLFLDFVCLEKGGVDLGWFTEVDPTWNNDVWAGILNPEAILFSNPVAQMACIADATTANLGFPLDILFWCAGSWGSIYPFSANSSQADVPSGRALIATRGIAKLHRQLMLWGSIGGKGLCGMYPMPIMRKSQYSLLPVHPVPWKWRVPIGRSSILWAEGQRTPLVDKGNSVFVLYRKRDCCAF